jgi:hypothetical protein
VKSAPFSVFIKNIFRFLPVTAYQLAKKIALNSALKKYKTLKSAFRAHFAFWLESTRLKMAVCNGMRPAKRFGLR